MDVEATELAAQRLEDLAAGKYVGVPGAVGILILRSAAYHLRWTLHGYLTKGEKA